MNIVARADQTKAMQNAGQNAVYGQPAEYVIRKVGAGLMKEFIKAVYGNLDLDNIALFQSTTYHVKQRRVTRHVSKRIE
jgi:hypothetical protein